MSSRQMITLAWMSAAAFAATLSGPSTAGAALHSLQLSVYQPGYSGASKVVYLSIEGVDPALSTQFTVRRAGVATPIEDEFEFSGASSLSTYDLDLLEPGDLLEIRQPSTSPTPTVSFQTPAASLSFAGSSVTGVLGAGSMNTLSVQGTCLTEQTGIQLPASGGPFSQSFAAGTLPPGARVQLGSVDNRGFNFEFSAVAPGERACVYADGSSSQSLSRNPGAKDPTPYYIQLDQLTQSTTTTRLVLRRGGGILEDKSGPSSSSFSANLATAPRPGDLIEIYRPQAAGTPTQVVTIPQVSGTFDPAVDLAAIDGPAARESRVFACTPLICTGSGRTLLDTPPGRAFFDFTKSDGGEPVTDLLPDSLVEGTFQSASEPVQYRFAMPAGDPVAPKLSMKLAAKLSRVRLVKAFKRGFKVKLRSDEVGQAKLTLAFPKAKAGRAVTLAKASKGAKVGATTIALKFTKAGKKALKKMRKRGSRVATLTSTVTDASGNTSTLVKRLKIKA
ncbi:MAG: hypothetical protein HYX29_01810 [Solirubrobacterales bacterium]|nr:hypothetical protein [Solirubrobacterales bacterium]